VVTELKSVNGSSRGRNGVRNLIIARVLYRCGDWENRGRAALAGDGKVTFVNVTRGNSFTATAALSGRQKRIVLNGGLLAAVASGHVS